MTSLGDSGRDRNGGERLLQLILPLATLALGVLVWELTVRIDAIPPYVLPAPSLVLQTLFSDREILLRSLLVTLITTFEGLLLAIIGGVWGHPDGPAAGVRAINAAIKTAQS